MSDRMRHLPGKQEVAHRHNSQQEKINAAAFVIEIIRKCRDEQQACRRLFLQQRINQAEP